jgi:hypothetical protein
MNRKHFILILLRTVILGIFALMIGIFASNGKITRPGDCVSGFQCKACGELKNCRLPESDTARNNG